MLWHILVQITFLNSYQTVRPCYSRVVCSVDPLALTFAVAGDRLYVVDVHIPDTPDPPPAYMDDRVLSPAIASGLQRSQTPVRSASVALDAPHNRLHERAQREAPYSMPAVSIIINNK